MKRKHRGKGVFAAANAMELGKLPKRKDAVEYIKYLQGTLDFTLQLLTKREQELKALGWKRPTWNPVSDNAVWVHVGSTDKTSINGE